MANYKLVLSYDGTAYHGWQRQKNGITIQECLEGAILAVTGRAATVHGCGRTDAGVHALCYTCNFELDTSIPAEKLPFALNTKLPPDIRVFGCEIAPDDFHARFSAKEKTYCYSIYNRVFANPFYSRYSWHYPLPLQVSAMQEAAALMVGRHDFKCFQASGSPVVDTVRTIYGLEIAENETIDISVTANGFLYNMVRIIAGTLVYVGCGKLQPSHVADMLTARDRRLAGVTAPPQGLRLVKTLY